MYTKHTKHTVYETMLKLRWYRHCWTVCVILTVAVLLVFLLWRDPMDNGPTGDPSYPVLLDPLTEDDWYPISENIFVYSAFYDAVKFTAAYILCYTSITLIPHSVALVSRDEHNQTLQPIPVHQIARRNYTLHYLVCVPPLHSAIDINQLVTWIELNRILGVEMFLIYNFGAPEVALTILRHYQSRGILRILPWSLRNSNIRSVMEGSMHYYGQLAAINDCLYRSKMESKYVASFDLDEFIVPQAASHLTWDHMFRFRPDFDIFQFRNVFFVPENDTRTGESSPYVFHRTRRCRNMHVHGDRSKIIAKSSVVVTMGIHEVWAARSNKVDAVSSTSGLLHHYRPQLPVPCDTITTSNVISKYNDVLRENVNRTLTLLTSAKKSIVYK